MRKIYVLRRVLDEILFQASNRVRELQVTAVVNFEDYKKDSARADLQALTYRSGMNPDEFLNYIRKLHQYKDSEELEIVCEDQ